MKGHTVIPQSFRKNLDKHNQATPGSIFPFTELEVYFNPTPIKRDSNYSIIENNFLFDFFGES